MVSSSNSTGSASASITAAVILERALYLIGEAVMVGFETEEAGSADAQRKTYSSSYALRCFIARKEQHKAGPASCSDSAQLAFWPLCCGLR